MSVADRRLCNVTSVHSGSTDYVTLVRPFYLILSLLYSTLKDIVWWITFRDGLPVMSDLEFTGVC